MSIASLTELLSTSVLCMIIMNADKVLILQEFEIGYCKAEFLLNFSGNHHEIVTSSRNGGIHLHSGGDGRLFPR